MAQEGVAIVGEDAEGSSQAPQVTKTREEAVVEKAKTLGWKPEEDFHGDQADWVPAKEFLARQSLFDKIHSLRNELFQERKQNATELGKIKEYIATISDTEYKRAVADLQNQRRAAIAEGDVAAAEVLDGKIDDVKTAARELKEEKKAEKAADTNAPHPHLVEWVAENKWFDADPVLRNEAESIGMGLAMKQPDLARTNPKAILAQVKERIIKLYPEKFAGEQPKAAPTTRVEGGTTRPATKGNTVNGRKIELTWQDLTPEQKSIGKTVINSGVLNTKAEKNKVSPQEQYLLDMQDNLAQTTRK